MVTKKVKIQSKFGLHLRPASNFAALSQKFASLIEVEYNGEVVDGKSIIGLLQLGVQPGNDIMIRIQGNDEHEAADALLQLVHRDINNLNPSEG